MQTDMERLMTQLREANERLIVAAVRAQDRSDEAQAVATQAKADLAHLLDEMQERGTQLTSASAQARIMEEEARQREEAYRRLSRRLLQMQDEERRRLARDLHDSTGQTLVSLLMHLAQVEKGSLNARSRAALAASRALADQCAREVRTLAYLLHPPLLDEAGLPSAVRWYAEGFTKRSGIQAETELEDVGRLPESIAVALFRVVQESLTNIHRHAPTSTASIRLTRTARALVLEIRDTGRGFRDALKQDGTPEFEKMGVGIAGMRERIAQIGGTFDAVFTDRGTTIRVEVALSGRTP